MKPPFVKAIAPATSANLGAGFDVFGVALDGLVDFICVQLTESNRIEISLEGKGAETIPTEPSRNTAGIVAEEMLAMSDQKCGLRIVIEKGIRPGSGLGSSAASAAGTAVALNSLLGLGLSKTELIGFAAQGEKAAAGVAHADNVSAAILGGFVIIVSREPLEIASLNLPEGVEFAVVFPEISVNTSIARSVLPKEIPLSNMVYNVGRAATFVAGVALRDIDLMGKGMSDIVIEPARASLIPGLQHVKKKAMDAGASGVAISGSGPSVLALVNSKKVSAMIVALAMQEAFEKSNVRSQPLCAKPAAGARIIPSKDK